jgi:hypothetical protein
VLDAKEQTQLLMDEQSQRVSHKSLLNQSEKQDEKEVKLKKRGKSMKS